MRRSFRQSCAYIGLCIGACLLIVFSHLQWNIAPSQAQSQLTHNLPPVEISEGWQYHWGDLPLDESGIPALTQQEIEGFDWQSFQIPTKLKKLGTEEFVWLRVPLPEGQWQSPSLYLKAVPHLVAAYLDREPIYQYFHFNSSSAAQLDFDGYQLPLVFLPPDFPGKTLFFRVYAGSTTSINIGLFERVLVGSQAALIKRMFFKEIDSLLGVLLTIFGIISIFVGIRRQTKNVYFAFSSLVICVGIPQALDSDFRALLLNHDFCDFIVHTSFYLVPISAYIFFEQMFGAGFKSIIRRLWQIQLVYLGIAIALVSSQTISWEQALYPALLLFLLSDLILLATAFKMSKNGNRDTRLFVIGFIIMNLCAFHDALNYLFASPLDWYHELYPVGSFIFIFILLSILERRFTETKILEAQNSSLQRMDKLKDEFLANTSHELRTPLNGIIGIAESLVDGATGKLSQPTVDNLSLIVASGRRLTQLVNDLLDFSKLRHHNISLQIKPVGMREITNIVLTLAQPLIGNKKLQLVNSIPVDVPLVAADENRLQQILYNLVGNGIKFTEAGMIEVAAQQLTANGELLPMLAITVSDTGIGISEDQLDRIFESFEQADGSISREYGGTGLGLAVTKQLVELHGGEIKVKSKPGNGSKFTFTLPVSQERGKDVTTERRTEKDQIILTSEPPLVISNQQPTTNNQQPTTNQFNILIVDDEPVNRQVLVNHLSLHNYGITQAVNGQEALALINDGLQPDLVLLDVMMPKMTGYEVCQVLRQKFPATELPIVLLTAKNQVSDLVEGFSAGANDYLTKPVSKNELLARMRIHIQLSKINLAYSRFVPHEFLQFMDRESIVDVQLGDQVQQEMTVLFSDIRSFTTLSESMSPKENFDFLNQYLKRVGPVIRNHQGFIDKYIGDAVMALFPQTADDAITAAIEMQKQVSLFNLERQAQGYPPIAIGVGLHTGSLMVGTIGEEQRMESTVIADAVNLASRLEGLTKVYGAGILVSEQTLSRLQEPEKYSHRFLGRVTVKGKTVSVGVFEIYEGDSDELKEFKRQTQEKFERGVELFEQEEFAEAQLVFEALWQQNEQDQSAKVYIERSQQCILSNKPLMANG
ncbi:MAG: response regulator [Symploca sp. SIO2C1]|nr:response regulator [Symploca sp. SIO2C1]